MDYLKTTAIKMRYTQSLSLKSFLCLVFFVGFLSEKAFLQPLNMDTSVHPTELKLFKYEPKGQPNGKGMLNITKVVQIKDTAYYFCKGISIYSPAIVQVTVKDKTAPVQVSLHKWNWKEKSREGVTDAKGIWAEKFKTENDFGIKVVAPAKPAAYILYVWVGDEVKVSVPSDFTSPEKVKEQKTATSKSFLKKNALYIIIGVLLIVVIALFIKRRKK
jgi:hypothetical protein